MPVPARASNAANERPATNLHVRLPRLRHESPWTNRAILVACLVGAAVLAPLWIDPVSLGLLSGAPTPTATPPPSVVRPTILPEASQPSRTSRIVVQDQFDRVVDGSWGSSPTGGLYQISGAGQAQVGAGHATVSLSSPGAGSAILGSVAQADVSVAVNVAASRTRANGQVNVAIQLRATNGTYYQVVLELGPDSASLAIDVVVDGVPERLSASVALDGVETSGTIRVRVEAIGRDPTTIHARAWNAAQDEPSGWAVSTIDWHGRLQAPGALGIGWSAAAASDSAPIEIRLDDLVGRTYDEESAP